MLAIGSANLIGSVKQVMYKPIHKEKKVRLQSQEEQRIIVVVKQAKRATEGKMKGKVVYETVESLDVYDAKPEEVVLVISNGLRAAANGGRK